LDEPIRLPYSGFVASHRIAGQEPRVPPALRGGRGETRVEALLCVAPDGRVSEAHVMGDGRSLAEAVDTAVRTWRYRPFVVQGRPRPVCFSVPFRVERRDERME
jgi:protein TonB